MPVFNGVGHSDWTSDKLHFFSLFVIMHLEITKSVMRKWNKSRYYYFDLNAGCGFDPATGSPGSPVIFSDIANQLGIDHTGHMIEINRDNCDSLQSKLNEGEHFRSCAIHGDHNKYMRQFCQDRYRNEFGLFYADPNAVNDAPLSLLSELSLYWKRADILMMLPAATLKRVSRRFNRATLAHHFDKIHKKNIMIKKPVGKHEFTFVYCTNGPVLKWEKQDFYDIMSEDGQRVFDKLNRTNHERKTATQPNLFDLPPIQDSSSYD